VKVEAILENCLNLKLLDIRGNQLIDGLFIERLRSKSRNKAVKILYNKKF